MKRLTPKKKTKKDKKLEALEKELKKERRAKGSIVAKQKRLLSQKDKDLEKVDKKAKRALGKHSKEVERLEKQIDLRSRKDKELLKELNRRGYLAIKKERKQFETYEYPDITDTYKVGIISDTHLASGHQQLQHLNHFYRECKKREIKKVFHAGDLVDGEKVYTGQEYEIFVHGATNQRNYVVKNYPKIAGIKTYAIAGNHDEAFWKRGGFEVIEAIAHRRKDIESFGFYGAFLNIGNITIELNHGDAGVAYARSYKLQKAIEQMPPETKPHIFLQGHYHVTCYIHKYRNVEGFMLGCFQSQTSYLKRKKLSPDVTGLFLTINQNSKGLDSVAVQYKPYYEPIKNDY